MSPHLRARLTPWLLVAGFGCAGPPASLAAPSGSARAAALDRGVADAAPRLQKDTFGSLHGQAVERYTLTNARGSRLRVITYGAIITELEVPDREGRLADVVLGHADLDGYLTHGSYFGAIVGRVANRIRDAAFELEGRRYTLAANDGRDHLHGGVHGWHEVLWRADAGADASSAWVRLRHESPDGDEGYPGKVEASVTYTLTDDDVVRVDMRARADRTTLVNLAQHTYWNLGGHGSGSVLGHELTLHADAYTPGDPKIPDGRVLPVAGTRFDFTAGAAVGGASGGVTGFDHNFVVRGEPHGLRPVARLVEPQSGRVMTLEADQPGVQLYTANHLKGSFEGKGARYEQYAGVCLETQAFPNAINVPEWRPDVILTPHGEYQHHMVFRFSTQPPLARGASSAHAR